MQEAFMRRAIEIARRGVARYARIAAHEEVGVVAVHERAGGPLRVELDREQPALAAVRVDVLDAQHGVGGRERALHDEPQASVVLLGDEHAAVRQKAERGRRAQSAEDELVDEIGGEDAIRNWLEANHKIGQSTEIRTYEPNAPLDAWGVKTMLKWVGLSGIAGLDSAGRLEIGGLVSVWTPQTLDR